MNWHKWSAGLLMTAIMLVFNPGPSFIQEQQPGEKSPQVDRLTGQESAPQAAPVAQAPIEISRPLQNTVQPQRAQQSPRPEKAPSARQDQHKAGSPPSTTVNIQLNQDEQLMVDMVNQARIKNGSGPLSVNIELTRTARAKAGDMIAKNYFSHTSPTFGSPFDMMRHFGIVYRTAGENLAGAGSVDKAQANLMNSPGHRANILNGNYREIGIGVVSGGPYGKIFVQLFIG